MPRLPINVGTDETNGENHVITNYTNPMDPKSIELEYAIRTNSMDDRRFNLLKGENIMILLVWLALSIFLGIAAQRHFDRNGLGWACIGLVISPIMGLLLLLAVGKWQAPVPVPKVPRVV